MRMSPRRLSSSRRGNPSVGQPLRGTRACTSCHRKKIKCDKALPVCSLCCRTGNACVFPIKRKPRTRRIDLPIVHASHVETNVIESHKDGESSANRVEPSGELLLGQAPSSGSEVLSNEASQQLLSPALIHEPHEGYGDTTSFDLGSRVEGVNETLLDSPSTFGLQTAFYESNSELPFFGMPFLGHNLYQSSSFIQSQAEGVRSTPESLAHSLPQGENVTGLPTPARHRNTCPSEMLHSNDVRQLHPRSFDNTHGLFDFPTGLFDELINIWFDKIQSFLPLLHRPRFVERLSSIRDAEGLDYQNLDWEVSLLLNAMFAMAARFSNSPYFAGKPFPERGEDFAKRAKILYESSLSHLRVPTLIYLQGLTILAFYLYAMEPDSQGWVLIGICSRLAYELELDKIDETANSEVESTGPEEWSRQEERRRLWWCIWELDGFAAAIACRRPTVDKQNMQVMLPVSDETWFANTPVESAIIDPASTKSWRTLEKCENQNVRAWFLLANFLLLSAHDLAQSKNPSMEDVKALETAVACFFLIVPCDFNLPSPSLSFTDETYQRSNWIISMNIMLQGTFIFLRLVGERSAGNSFHNSNNHFVAPLAAGAHFKICTTGYHVNAEQIFTAVRLWNPAYIALHTPFIACLVIGPAAVILRTAIEIKKDPATHRQFTGLELDLLNLVLHKIARYWKFGSILRDIVQNVCKDHALARSNAS